MITYTNHVWGSRVHIFGLVGADEASLVPTNTLFYVTRFHRIGITTDNLQLTTYN
jgi:hypothetical protein